MFKVEFETANAAFTNPEDFGGNEEIAHILAEIAEKIRGNMYGVDVDVPIRDSNGSRIGSWRYSPDWGQMVDFT